MTFRFFMQCLPALCYLAAAAPAYYMSIAKEQHDGILAILNQRDSARFSSADAASAASSGLRSFIDPITHKPASVVDNSAAGIARAHFTAYEASIADRHGLNKLRSYLFGRTVLWGGLLATLICLCVVGIAVDEIDSEMLITFCALLMAALFVLIPWECALDLA
jgi:hypothetical protein